MSEMTECNDVDAQVAIDGEEWHESRQYQLLAGPALDRDSTAAWLQDKAVVLRLADGDSMVRIGLTAEQARRVEGAIGEALRGPAAADGDPDA